MLVKGSRAQSYAPFAIVLPAAAVFAACFTKFSLQINSQDISVLLYGVRG